MDTAGVIANFLYIAGSLCFLAGTLVNLLAHWPK